MREQIKAELIKMISGMTAEKQAVYWKRFYAIFPEVAE